MEYKATYQQIVLITAFVFFTLSLLFSILMFSIENVFRLPITDMKWYWVMTIISVAVLFIALVIFFQTYIIMALTVYMENKLEEKRLLVEHKKRQTNELKNNTKTITNNVVKYEL